MYDVCISTMLKRKSESHFSSFKLPLRLKSRDLQSAVPPDRLLEPIQDPSPLHSKPTNSPPSLPSPAATTPLKPARVVSGAYPSGLVDWSTNTGAEERREAIPRGPILKKNQLAPVQRRRRTCLSNSSSGSSPSPP